MGANASPRVAVDAPHRTHGRPQRRWWAWAVGLLGLVTVVATTLHLGELSAFVAIARRARPGWLVALVALQATTYLAQAALWRGVAHLHGVRLPVGAAYRASVAKVFVDQALPSGGLSGAILVARVLRTRGLSTAAATAGAVVETVAFYLAYAASLIATLVVIVPWHATSAATSIAVAVACLLAVAGAAIGLALPGRPPRVDGARRGWSRPVQRALDVVRSADRRTTRDVGLGVRATACQAAILALDAASLGAALVALGGAAPPGALFAAYVIASLVRMLGVLPGGVGAFEAASVAALHAFDVDLATALSATLLYRVASFWLPMVPGAWLARELAPARTRPAWASIEAPWSMDGASVLSAAASSASGLSDAEAERRARRIGPNAFERPHRFARLAPLANQLRNPLSGLLVVAAAIAAATGAWTEAALVTLIVAATVGVGWQREARAGAAAERLRARVGARASVLRSGRRLEVALERVVPGDVVELSAGTVVAADARLLAATDLHVSEALLTGESFPVAKSVAPAAVDAPLSDRVNMVYAGTNVRAGTGTAVVTATGRSTRMGAVAHRLVGRAPETAFDRGLRRFGGSLTVAMLALVLVVFAVHVLAGRPPATTLLFAVALGVGLSPELLPAVLGVNLARGATAMARHGVLVRRLTAIENLGAMDVLCTDKTGTLTEGVIALDGAFDAMGRPDPATLDAAYWNARLQTGTPSPLDDAILRAGPVSTGPERVKLAEIPFDFVRKRVSVVVRDGARARLVSKGAVGPMLAACRSTADGVSLDAARSAAVHATCDAWSDRGIRVLAVAERVLDVRDRYGTEDERDLALTGFLTFLDRPKPEIETTLVDLARLGVAVKVITGDDRRVARHLAVHVGLASDRVVTGGELDRMSDEALWHVVGRTDLFAEVDPNQKERVLRALRREGHVVGFLGDGVNDAPALHAADVGLSVDGAVDVARDAADIVLLERDLAGIRRGIEEGRRTFANTMTYIRITTSANLGNMLSMAAASLALPYLPLTASQILLNNFLSDVPALGVADDAVDPERVARPGRWDVRALVRYMVAFGALSSVFDLATFALLLGPFRVGTDAFRTGWFVESLLTELAVALVIRTARPFYRSRPGSLLLRLTGLVGIVAVAAPYLPWAGALGFVPLPAPLVLALIGVTAAYVAAVEAVKRVVTPT